MRVGVIYGYFLARKVPDSMRHVRCGGGCSLKHGICNNNGVPNGCFCPFQEAGSCLRTTGMYMVIINLEKK
jgi:hypothetical protein